MTPVNSYLTQREREMSAAPQTANIHTNTSHSGLVQRLMRVFSSRDSRAHASLPLRSTGTIQSMPGEVI